MQTASKRVRIEGPRLTLPPQQTQQAPAQAGRRAESRGRLDQRTSDPRQWRLYLTIIMRPPGWVTRKVPSVIRSLPGGHSRVGTMGYFPFKRVANGLNHLGTRFRGLENSYFRGAPTHISRRADRAIGYAAAMHPYLTSLILRDLEQTVSVTGSLLSRASIQHSPGPLPPC